MFSSVFSICAWINGWVINGEPGDLRRHRADYDVTVMVQIFMLWRRDTENQFLRDVSAQDFFVEFGRSIDFGLRKAVLVC